MKPLIVFSDVTIDGFMAGLDNDLDFMATLGVVARYHDCTLKEAPPRSNDVYRLLLKRRPSLYTGSLLYCHGRYCSVRTSRGFAGSQLPRGPPEAGIRDRN